MTHSAEYGAAGSFTRPDTPPASSMSVLVTQFEYDGFGRNHLTTTPDGTQTLQVFDDLHRVTHVIENYKPNSQGQQDYWYTDNGQEDYDRPKALGLPTFALSFFQLRWHGSARKPLGATKLRRFVRV